MSAWEPAWTMVASSTAGRASRLDAADRSDRRPPTGMKMVMSPRSSEKKSLAITLPGRSGRRHALRGERRGELPERALEPGPQVVEADRLGDGAVSSVGSLRCSMRQRGRRTLEQPPQGGHRLLGLDEALLQPGQVLGDQLVAGVDVGRLQHGADLLQRHVELPEPPDDLRRGDLLGAVTAVARVRVDRGRGRGARAGGSGGGS